MANIYIHYPFCKKACHYCNFHFSTNLKNQSVVLEGILKEIELRSSEMKSPIESIYFGGGSPSIIESDFIEKILNKVFESLNVADTTFADKLVDWADIIRKTFYDGGIDEVISTRRLVHISKAFSIFEDRSMAIDLCINRFDDETKEVFKDLYTKLDAEVEVDASPDLDLDMTPF